MKIPTDPNTKSGGFGYAEAGAYKLRVKIAPELKDGPKAQYLKWQFEFVDPNVTAVDLELTLGVIFENTTLADAGQFRLKQLADALGMVWGAEFDTDLAIGREFDAQVGVKAYNGKMSNEITQYVPA